MLFALSTIILSCTLGLLFRIVAIESKDPRTFSFVFNSVICLMALIAVIVFGIGNIKFDLYTLVLVTLSGSGYGIFQRYQFTIRKYIEASIIQLIVTPTAIVGYTLALFWLGEAITFSQYIGFILVIVAGLMVTVRKEKKLVLNRYVIGALLIGSALSIGVTISKVAVNSFESALTYVLIIFTMQAMWCFFPFVQPKKVVEELRKHTWKIPFLAIINFVLLVVQIAAIRIVPATKLIPILASNVVLMTVLAIILLKERDRIWLKIIAAFLTMVGVILSSR